MPMHYDDGGILEALRRLLGGEPQDTVPQEPQQAEPAQEGMLAGLLGLFRPSPEEEMLRETIAQPLYQDTVYPLIGGEPGGGVEVTNPFFVLLDKVLRRNLGATAGPYREDVSVRPAALNPENPGELQRILFHEMGHISDFRGEDAPLGEVREQVRERFPELEGFTSYASVNEEEHFAEAFQSGLDFIRLWNRMLQENPDSAERVNVWNMLQLDDAGLPGTVEVVKALIEHPLYKDSPVAQNLREHDGPDATIYEDGEFVGDEDDDDS